MTGSSTQSSNPPQPTSSIPSSASNSPPSLSPSISPPKSNKGVIAGATVGASIVALVTAVGIYYYHRKHQTPVPKTDTSPELLPQEFTIRAELHANPRPPEAGGREVYEMQEKK